MVALQVRASNTNNILSFYAYLLFYHPNTSFTHRSYSSIQLPFHQQPMTSFLWSTSYTNIYIHLNTMLFIYQLPATPYRNRYITYIYSLIYTYTFLLIYQLPATPYRNRLYTYTYIYVLIYTYFYPFISYQLHPFDHSPCYYHSALLVLS